MTWAAIQDSKKLQKLDKTITDWRYDFLSRKHDEGLTDASIDEVVRRLDELRILLDSTP